MAKKKAGIKEVDIEPQIAHHYETGVVEGAQELEDQLNGMFERGWEPKFITEDNYNMYTIVYSPIKG